MNVNFLKSDTFKHPLIVGLLVVFVTAILGGLGFLIKHSYFEDKQVQFQTSVNQNHSGSGDNVAGDKKVFNFNSGIPDRHLTGENVEALKFELKKAQFQKTDILTVSASSDDAEKINLANEIKKWLQKEGYSSVRGVDISFGMEYEGKPVEGVLFYPPQHSIIVGSR